MKYWKVGVFLGVLFVGAYLVWRTNERGGRGGDRPLVKSSGAVLRLPGGTSVDVPAPKRKYKLGVLFPFLAAPFWVNESYGILDQCQKLGVDVVWLSADGYDNIDKQNNQMEDLVTRRVDAILLGATSYTGTVTAVDKAASAGVPVFAHVTSSASKNIVAAVLDDDLEIGRRQGEFMGSTLQGKGNVAMLNGPAAAEWSSNRVKGFKEVLAKEFPGIRVVAERFGIPDRADAQRLTEDILTTFPNLNGVFTVADGMAMGAADAAKTARRIERITITTASFSRESVVYLKEGYIAVNVDENPVLMGRTIVNTVVRALNGETVPEVIYVPNPSITRATVNSVEPGQQWSPEGWHIH